MFWNTQTESSRSLVLGGVLVGAALLTPSWSRACESPMISASISSQPILLMSALQDEPSRLRVIAVHGDDDAKEDHAKFEARLHRSDDGREIDVTISDGGVTARINGEEVPAERIHREDDRIVILDASGRELESIWIGSDRALRWKPHAPAQAPEPNVMLGILLGTPDRALERHLKLKPGTTTMITALHEGLPAHEAGLGEFDIITVVDGKTPADPPALLKALEGKEAGDTIRLDFIHDGEPQRITVTLAAYDRKVLEQAPVIGADPRRSRTLEFFGDRDVPFGRGMERLQDLGIDIQEMMPEVFFDDDERIFEMPSPGHSRDAMRDFMEERARPRSEDRELREIDERLEALERMLAELIERQSSER